MIGQDEIIQIVAKEHDVVLGKDDAVLVFLTVHDTLLKARMEELESELQAKMLRITDQYQERAKTLAESIVGNAVRKIAAERQEIQNGMQRLCQQEKTDMGQLIRTVKLAAGVVSAALIIAAMTITFFNSTYP